MEVKDATSSKSIHVAYSFDDCIIPSNRSLGQVLESVVKHGQENPSHGTNCACVDRYIQELRIHVNRAMGVYAQLPPGSPDWEKRFEARMRVAHVLTLLARSI